jgi:hypothetical protein
MRLMLAGLEIDVLMRVLKNPERDGRCVPTSSSTENKQKNFSNCAGVLQP